MRKFFYGFVCLMAVSSLQGCFWHSTTEKDVVEQPSGQSSTTVVTPASSATTVTSH